MPVFLLADGLHGVGVTLPVTRIVHVGYATKSDIDKIVWCSVDAERKSKFAIHLAVAAHQKEALIKFFKPFIRNVV